MVKYADGRYTKKHKPHPACLNIVMSDRALAQVYSEMRDKDNNETGGLLLGHIVNNMWYIVESSDPGHKGKCYSTYHENDEDYANHVCTILSRVYKYPLNFLGMWHRHTGSKDLFSATDDSTNIKYAKSAGNGCISLIVNQDPIFRITAYYVDVYREECIKYIKTDLAVGNQYLGRCDIMEIATPSDIDKYMLN